jgi:hypothetical protein
VTDVCLYLSQDLDVLVSSEGCCAVCLVCVDGHFDLADAALADETGPDKVGEVRLVFGDRIALDDTLEPTGEF